jgi:hypothetical protein
MTTRAKVSIASAVDQENRSQVRLTWNLKYKERGFYVHPTQTSLSKNLTTNTHLLTSIQQNRPNNYLPLQDLLLMVYMTRTVPTEETTNCFTACPSIGIYFRGAFLDAKILL